MEIIKNFENYSIDKNANVYNNNTGKKLKHSTKGNKYKFISLKNGNNYSCMYVHRLIAIQFIHNPENKPEVNHINGIKSDNRIENLEWCTRSENSIHAIRTGLKVSTEKHKIGMSKFNKRTKSKLVINTQSGIFYDSAGDAAKCHNINRKTLICILGGFDNNKTNLKYA